MKKENDLAVQKLVKKKRKKKFIRNEYQRQQIQEQCIG